MVIWNLTSAIEATTAENPNYIPTNPYIIIIIIELERRGDLMISKPDFQAHLPLDILEVGETHQRQGLSTLTSHKRPNSEVDIEETRILARAS